MACDWNTRCNYHVAIIIKSANYPDLSAQVWSMLSEGVNLC